MRLQKIAIENVKGKFMHGVSCLTLSLSCLIACAAHATDLGLTVVEKGQASYGYVLDPKDLKSRQAHFELGQDVPQIQSYSIEGGSLRKSGASLTDATEILYQCSVDGIELVVIRVEKNSFLSPKKWLAALVGHPVQRSTVVVLKINGTKIIGALEVLSRDASYSWEARITELKVQR